MRRLTQGNTSTLREEQPGSNQQPSGYQPSPLYLLSQIPPLVALWKSDHDLSASAQILSLPDSSITAELLPLIVVELVIKTV